MWRMIVVLSLLFNQVAFAECNYAEDIKKQSETSYSYTKECHVEVGMKFKELDLRIQQVEYYKRSLDSQQGALNNANARIELWRNTAFQLEDRVNKIDSYRERQNWIWFGLGILATGLAVHGASKLVD